ncbi:MAG: YmfQ family protein [Magnetovibrionaceae bacterium]
MTTARIDAAAYAEARGQLMPTGGAWPRDPDSVQMGLQKAKAEEDARVHNRALDLIEESDPRTAVEMLIDWEGVCGLPRPCTAGEAETLSERQAAVHAHLTSTGGQSRAYIIELARLLGYEITITEHRPFTCESGCEDPVADEEWRFAWIVNAPETTIREFTCESSCEDPLRSWGNKLLECAISRVKPAHTNCLFAYGV